MISGTPYLLPNVSDRLIAQRKAAYRGVWAAAVAGQPQRAPQRTPCKRQPASVDVSPWQPTSARRHSSRGHRPRRRGVQQQAQQQAQQRPDAGRGCCPGAVRSNTSLLLCSVLVYCIFIRDHGKLKWRRRRRGALYADAMRQNGRQMNKRCACMRVPQGAYHCSLCGRWRSGRGAKSSAEDVGPAAAQRKWGRTGRGRRARSRPTLIRRGALSPPALSRPRLRSGAAGRQRPSEPRANEASFLLRRAGDSEFSE